MEPLACGKAFYFDARGDLTINVGDKNKDKTRVYEFVVCSRSLARWSSVLCAMLFSGFAESRPRNRAPWIIEMPEDSVSPMFLVLSIVHGHFQHIPEKLDQHDLYQLLVVTEKYDMARILKPWASSWFQPYTLSHTPLSEGKAINLWIAWELGHTETFQAYAEELVLKSRINDEGMLLDSDGIALDTYLFLEPPGIIDRIKLIRETSINKMTSTLYDAIYDALTRSKGLKRKGSGRYCKHSTEETERCSRQILGSLIQQVYDLGMEDVALLQSTSSEYLGSMNDLCLGIRSITISNVCGKYGRLCSPLTTIQDMAKDLVAEMESPVTEFHLKYLRDQAKKTGV
ncbi:hypothetical protein LY78DRAFT_705150 [Colletotrichum sublineola]|nr:hypothetical protein LY78DRAFT_705150 [Colletotrichum sublineola]